jgi:hypothetical protein
MLGWSLRAGRTLCVNCNPRGRSDVLGLRA